MVETAALPELKLRPQFRAEQEVKLMATLEKPRKVTGVRTGKIPLVKPGQTPAVDSWPAGNPSAIKHANESQFYEMAEDEPYYAAQEVERLEDSLLQRQPKKSDIIERITASRHQRHKTALEDLHEELGHLNKNIDPQVSNHLDSAKEETSWIISEIQILFSGIDKDPILYTYPLRKLEVLWDDVVTLLQKRSNKISDLRDRLNKTETERKDQIAELFKHYSQLYHEIAYLSTVQINELMDTEVHSSNQLLLFNYKHYANLISQIQLENVLKLREYRVKWEERVATWRDLHVHQTSTKFVGFMGTPAIVQCPDITSLVDQMTTQLNGLLERRFRKLKTITDLCPPDITTKAVERWHGEVCDLSMKLENSRQMYLSKLANVGEKVVLDCEKVADRMLLTLQEEGVCSPEESENLKQSALMPLIYAWDQTNRDKIEVIGRTFEVEAAEFKSDLHILYSFQHTAALIWSSYCTRVESKKNELAGLMKKCRHKHDEINQDIESGLDMKMDKMRQDTNDLELKKHLDQSVECLKEIAGAYSNFKRDMAEVIRKYPGMVSVELTSYSSKINEHLGYREREAAAHKSQSDQAGEEECASEEEREISDKAPVEPATEVKEPVETEESAFLTEVRMTKSPYTDGQFLAFEEELTATYLDHLKILDEEVEEDAHSNVEEKLIELKSEVELRHHIHKPRAMRMKLDIFNVRLSELKNHEDRVKQHSAGIALEIATLRNAFKELGTAHGSKSKKFKQLVEDCEKNLPNLEKSAHLSSLQTKVTTAYSEHMTLIKLELSSFRNKMEEKLNDLRESNQHFGLAFKPFAEGGNFGPDEIETYRKRLEKCNLKIDNCETYVLTELDGMETKCLDAAVEITNNFDIKLKSHILDVAFLERVNSWMSNCQVKIKTEVAASNMMSKKLRSKIEYLRKLIDSCSRPHPDKAPVRPEEVIATIPDLYALFQRRISYLDCAKPPPQPAVTVEPKAPVIDQRDSLHDFQSIVNLTKNIINISRKYSSPVPDQREAVAQPVEKKKGGPTGALYDWFIVKQPEREKVIIPKRLKSRGDTAERVKRLGSASSRSSMVSVVISDAHSFVPMIKKILQETQGALFLSSEAYYSQFQGPSVRPGIAESLEQCMEGLNKRLNGYYLQTYEFYNKCVQELRVLLTDVLSLQLEIPELLFSEIFEKYVTEVSQKTSLIKHQFERSKLKIGDQREANKVMLKPILGHPNNEVDMNNLCRLEEDRSLHSGDVIDEFVNEMTNAETALAKCFVDSINGCTERLLHMFDQLITIDDVILGEVPEEKLPTTALLKRELRAKKIVETVAGLSRNGQQIKLLKLGDVTSKSNTSAKPDYLTTSKFTPVHDAVLASKDLAVKECRERCNEVTQELEMVQTQWRSGEVKWGRQWKSSVQSVRDLYKPSEP